MASHRSPEPTAAAAEKPPRVFISYSHDSPAQRRRVLDLALHLRDGGVDCDLDQFHEDEPPSEGWPAWMHRGVREAAYVLVVCTEAYYRRATGLEADGVGLGARWESQLITQAIYDAGGRNAKFIPVVFGAADLNHGPEYLRATTYYDVSVADRREELYWRVTKQPRLTKPPLGKLRVRPAPDPRRGDTFDATPEGGTEAGPKLSLALLKDAGGREVFIPLVSAEESAATTLVLQPDTGEARAVLDDLRTSRFGGVSVAVAYGRTAYRARLSSVVRSMSGAEDRYTLSLIPEREQGYGVIEMATTGYSADDLAELRARRILLNEALSTERDRSAKVMMFEAMVSGTATGFLVGESPLPDLYARMSGGSPARFVAAAELLAVLWLRLSGTVAHVLELDMRLLDRARLGVHFIGQRAQVYSNRATVTMTIDGECALGTAPA